MPIGSGARFNHYEVSTLLGKGGMGEVYLAQDTTLQRRVALKILPAEFTQDTERLRRFAQEARAVSALNHPNLVTIYEIGEQHGVNFMAYEYVDGQPLRDRLKKALSLPEALELALQMTTALAAAHAAGIIHRDIKPENVMVRRDGIVKVLDFGLAKLAEKGSGGEGERGRRGEDDPTLPLSPPLPRSPSPLLSTEAGVVMGTASYMSPEQARGERVDARSDLFSLGIVLYEMIAGRQPFTGVNMLDVIGAILHQEPAPIADAPVEVQRIVSKALQKDRTARYQTAQEFAHDLRELKDELAYQARAARTSDEQPTLLQAPTTTKPADEQAFSESPSGGVFAPQLQNPAEAGTLNTWRRRLQFSFVALVVVALAVAAFFYFKRSPALTDKDTILLADFTNTTNDPVFDGTLKQALAVHLGQSPFLNLFADERVRETLRLMNRSPDERVTPIVGREICQRQGLKAMLTGTIASLGRNYVINLEAVNAQTGDVLAREQGEAEGKEQVLRKLEEAANKMREKLGESLNSIQKYDVPLPQATTSSLEALKAYSLGSEQAQKGKQLAAIPLLKRAIELDPNFASAYRALAFSYLNSGSGQRELAIEAGQKAFELRARVSEREKLQITSGYHTNVTGEIYKAIEEGELFKQTYPREYTSRGGLGGRYAQVGQLEKAIEEFQVAIQLNPNFVLPYEAMVSTLILLNRFDEAKAFGEQAIAQKLDLVSTHTGLYLIAFIQGNRTAMQQQIDWANARPGEHRHLNWQANIAAFAGQWQKCREFSSRAIELAQQRDLQGMAGEIASSSAELAAVLGHCRQSRSDLARTTALPQTPLSYFRVGLALALCGQSAQAQLLTDEAVKEYPKNTLVNEIYLPLIRAALELQRGNRTQAIQILTAASRYESVSFFYQNYLRGQAYLGERNGAAAAREFQTILNHRGWSPTSPLYPLAHLGLARAAMLAGDTAKARQSYQEFFALWKDADTDLPVLIEAKREFEKLK